MGPTPPGRLLCLCFDYPPRSWATAVRTHKLLSRLVDRWWITVVTGTPDATEQPGIELTVVLLRGQGFKSWLERLHLQRLWQLLAWPDDAIFWVVPAVYRAWRVARARPPSAVVVFAMPYSAAIAGVMLARLCRVPLIINLDDSPTCSDMHPHYPSWFHFVAARRFEDWLAKRGDALIYVSRRNLEAARSRQPASLHHKYHLVRYGADPADFASRPADPERSRDVRIAYVGGMSGWYTLFLRADESSGLRRLVRRAMAAGTYYVVDLDLGASSPVPIAAAIRRAIAAHPEWDGRVTFRILGERFPPAVVNRVLDQEGIRDLVSVAPPVSHPEAMAIAAAADLLLATLPARPDGTPGGRISAKTYEYLMTDRPILAAVPAGENRDFLLDKPGTFLVDPSDIGAMAQVIEEIAKAKLDGKPLVFDRSSLREDLSYDARAAEFASVIDEALSASREQLSRG